MGLIKILLFCVCFSGKWGGQYDVSRRRAPSHCKQPQCTMMENAGSVASIRRPVPARSYSEYQYHYRGATTPTAAPTANGPSASGQGSGRKERSGGGCRCCRKCCAAPTASTLGNLGVCCLVLGYTVLGAFSFMALESGLEARELAAQQVQLNVIIIKNYIILGHFVKKLHKCQDGAWGESINVHLFIYHSLPV